MRLTSFAALLSCVFCCVHANGQVGSFITFRDYEDGHPIPYLKVCGKDTCLFTDIDGRIDISKFDLKNVERLSFNSLGYKGSYYLVERGSEIFLHQYEIELSGIRITAFQMDRANVETPGSTSLISKRTISSMDKTSLQNAVNLVPGVTMESRGYGGSQRISIRGSFIRSPFAVRNVKMYMEGIPFSSPDGSSPLELFDSDDIQGMEIIKGPGGSMYGNGTGGVMIFRPATLRPFHYLESEYTSGANGLRRTSNSVSIPLDKFSTRISHVYQENDGYRRQEFNRKQQITFTALRNDVGKNQGRLFIYGTWFKGHLGLPGGLNAAQVDDDPLQANLFSASNNASLYRERAMSGISYKSVLGNSGVISRTAAYFYYTDKQNPYGTSVAANGYKDEKATGYGLRNEFSKGISSRKIKWDIDAGFEIQAEGFEITESENEGGLPGSFKYNYDINYLSSFGWLRSQWSWRNRVFVEAGASANAEQNKVKGLNSANFSYDTTVVASLQWLPRAAISVQWLKGQWIHAGISQGNSMPTIFEQVDAVENTYNLNLNPEKGINREISLKGQEESSHFQYEISVYSFTLTNAIRSYADSVYVEPPGEYEELLRYRNEGGTEQEGIEVQLLKSFSFRDGYWLESINLTSALNLVRYSYDDRPEERIPGIPGAAVTSGMYLKNRKNLSFAVFHYWYDKMPLNDTNTNWSRPYHLLNLRLDYSLVGGSPMSAYKWDFFIGVNNILDAEYTSFVQINAPGARYFNPAAGINLYGGMRIGLPFGIK